MMYGCGALCTADKLSCCLTGKSGVSGAGASQRNNVFRGSMNEQSQAATIGCVQAWKCKNLYTCVAFADGQCAGQRLSAVGGMCGGW